MVDFSHHRTDSSKETNNEDDQYDKKCTYGTYN